MNTSKDKPVHEVRIGRIKAVVWRNETAAGVRHSVQLRRLYTVEDEGRTVWKSSDSLGRSDLLLAQKVLDLVHTWLYEQSASGDSAPEHVA